MAFILFFLLPSFILPVFIADSRYAKLLIFSFAALFMIYRSMKNRSLCLEANPVLLFFTGAFAFFLIPSWMLGNGYALFFYAIIFFVLIVAATFRLSDFREAAIQKWIVLATLWISFIGIQNYYGITFFNIKLYGAFERASILATIGNVNYVSNFLASVLPIVVITFLTTKEKSWRCLSFIATISSSVTILWGQTRSVYLGLFIAFFVFFPALWYSKHRKIYHKRNILGIIFGLTIIFVLFAFPPGVPDRKKPLKLAIGRAQELQTPYFETVGSGYRRVFEWRTAVEMLLGSPLYGWGWGSYMLLSSDFQIQVGEKDPNYFGYYEKSVEAHSDFLQILAETGIIGFCLWIALIVYIGYSGIKRWIETKNPLILAFFCGWLVIIIHALTEFPLHMMPSIAIFSLFTGFLLDSRKRILFRRWPSLVLLFLTLFLSFSVLRTTIADSLFAYGSFQKSLSESSFIKSIESTNESTQKVSGNLENIPEWFDSIARKEKDQAAAKLRDSYYQQYVLFTNALIADPNYVYAATELPFLIEKMGRINPPAPYLLFDFVPFQYTKLSELRKIPEEFPEIDSLAMSLKASERERVEYLYRYFQSLCLTLNSAIDSSVYINIGRAADEMLKLFGNLGIRVTQETGVWTEWMLFGYKKALQLDGARQYTPDFQFDHLDLEFLNVLIHHGIDTEENVLPILDFRLRLAQYTLQEYWRFPEKWYNFFLDYELNGKMTDHPLFRQRMFQLFDVYRSYYIEHEDYFNQLKERLDQKEWGISIGERYNLYRSLEVIERFLVDFEGHSRE